MRSLPLRFTLGFQGLYFIVSGLWAILDLPSFLAASGYPADPFKTHANALLFTAVGFSLFYAAYHSGNLYPAAVMGIFVSAGLFAVDYVYLPRIGQPLIVRLDLWLEAIAGIIYWSWLVLANRRATRKQ